MYEAIEIVERMILATRNAILLRPAYKSRDVSLDARLKALVDVLEVLKRIGREHYGLPKWVREGRWAIMRGDLEWCRERIPKGALWQVEKVDALGVRFRSYGGMSLCADWTDFAPIRFKPTDDDSIGEPEIDEEALNGND